MKVLIDSGAWSLHNQAQKKGIANAPVITIDDYCNWLTENRKLYTVYANFDVLNNGKASYENWVEMRKRGFNPLPVYHASTDIKWLKKYLDTGCEYLCLGAIAFMYTEYRIANLDHIWSNYLTQPDGMPKLKVHGFGLTALRIMTRYPWYSVDSSSWAFIARHGGLFIPKKIGGKFRFDEEHYKRNVSTRAPHKKSIPHVLFCSRQEQVVFQEYLDFIETPLGKSSFRPYLLGETLKKNELVWKKKENGKIVPLVEIVEERGVINDQAMRNEANIKFFILTAEGMPKYPWPFKRVHFHRRSLL